MSIGLNGDDVFERANTAKSEWNEKVAEEESAINGVWNILENIESKETALKMTLRANDEAEGTEITLTKENYAEHLGKIVTKYTGAPTSITVTSAGNKTYTVSNVYRLYYIDWDNKYGDGNGTIYLKADSTNNTYPLTDNSNNVLDGAADTSGKSKMKALNPLLYKTAGVSAPPSSYKNMSAVRWLTDTDNWDGLKVPSFSAKTNYIVGAPSLEMMIDSYNVHYGLIGDEPDASSITTGTRRKLFYQYPGLNQPRICGSSIRSLSSPRKLSLYNNN